MPTAPAGAPHLSATRFVAFGDNITEGFAQPCPAAASSLSSRALQRFNLRLAQGRAKPSPAAYPAQLQAMLEGRYPSQTVTVVNEGSSGEDIQAGVAALPRILTTNAPDVLLLQEGVNNINSGHAEAIPTVVNGLRNMIREAHGRGIRVFVGTLLPQRPGGCRAYDYADERDDTIPANVQIRGMVGNEKAVLVDLYEVFNGKTALLIGEDGLHPSAAGYREIAAAFFRAITRHLEARAAS